MQDVKDLDIEDIRIIAKRRASKDKKLQYKNWTFVFSLIASIVFVFSLIVYDIKYSDKEYIFVNNNGEEITSEDYSKSITIEGIEYKLKEDSFRNWNSRIFVFSGIILLCLLIKYYRYDRKKFINKFVQDWKDTGEIKRIENKAGGK